METLKQEIKKLVEEQKSLKNQRKTVNYQGIRTIEPWAAVMKHGSNREILRIMYAAYGVLRGKKYSEIENHYPEENHPLNAYTLRIKKLVEQYDTKETVHSDK